MATKDKREAPTKEPTAGKAAMAPLMTAGAGASLGAAVVAMAALMEAAAMRAVHAIFFISIASNDVVTRTAKKSVEQITVSCPCMLVAAL